MIIGFAEHISSFPTNWRLSTIHIERNGFAIFSPKRLLLYIGKTFSEKIEIIKIEMKNRDESKRIIEVNKNINLFLQENVLLSFVLNMDTEYNQLEYIVIDFNMYVKDVPYNEKIHISFTYDESHSDNKNLYINGVSF